MNKKFSTLLAGVALLGAMSANAGNPVTAEFNLQMQQNSD